MKKILGISLCALFAVSAANANIASTEWVEQQFEGKDLTATTGQYVTVVSQSNGKVEATGASFADAVATGGDNAPKSSAVVTYVQGQVQAATPNITTGTDNGTISVNGNDVAVAGLKALAYKDTVTNTEITNGTIVNEDISDSAAIESSKIAFNQIQTAVFGSGITSEYVNKIDNNADAISRLGTAAYTASTAYATTAQGAKADSAVQEADVTTGTNNGTIKVKDTEVAVAGLDALAYKATVTDADVAQNAAIKTSKIAFTPQQTAALNSEIDSTKVGQIAINAGSISDIQNFLDSMISEAAGYEECKTSGEGCTLVLSANGRFSWEKVTRAAE